MSDATGGGQASTAVDQPTAASLEAYRTELTGYCYRMLGSAFEAEDAVQDTMVRAWRSLDRFEGRSSLRSWLYRIATNVCLDMLGSSQRRARPMELGPAGSPDKPVLEPEPESVWLGPVPDERVLPDRGDPADVVVARDSIRLAFVAALQNLPARQRAVLILREVLAWSAKETADLLDTSVASVNSALQRARATLSTVDTASDPLRPMDSDQAELLDKFVRAFEAYDMEALATLLHQDAIMAMPPLPIWMRGIADIQSWMLGVGGGCRGSKLVPTIANGSPAFGHYKPSEGGGYEPWAVMVLEISDGKVRGINQFLDSPQMFPLLGAPQLFPLFGLPAKLDS